MKKTRISNPDDDFSRIYIGNSDKKGYLEVSIETDFEVAEFYLGKDGAIKIIEILKREFKIPYT